MRGQRKFWSEKRRREIFWWIPTRPSLTRAPICSRWMMLTKTLDYKLQSCLLGILTVVPLEKASELDSAETWEKGEEIIRLHHPQLEGWIIAGLFSIYIGLVLVQHNIWVKSNLSWRCPNISPSLFNIYYFYFFLLKANSINDLQ